MLRLSLSRHNKDQQLSTKTLMLNNFPRNSILCKGSVNTKSSFCLFFFFQGDCSMNGENRQALNNRTNQKKCDYTRWKIEIALSSVQHLPGCLVITHFLLDVPAKGKDARPVQASRKVSEGAVGVTV